MSICSCSPVLRAALLAIAPVLLSTAMAQPVQTPLKVIGADGRITYTDRAPTSQEGTVTALGARRSATPLEVELPYELRQATGRYPVTLYVIPGTCEPCDLGRALLRQRGVPHAEKRVQSAADVEAMEKLTGTRDTPTLTIGAQVLRGMAADAWNSYLDAAGYPRESKLPATYQAPPATTVVARREAAAAPVPPTPVREPAAARIEQRPLVTSGGIRF